MPIAQTFLLFKLVKSLTKGEKRHFKMYLKRIQQDGEVKFVLLFDVLDKQEEYNEEQVLKKLDSISTSQYSNLKRHLYEHLLTSLRLLHLKKNQAIKIRELIDYAQILYGKGLYIQALKILARAKSIAQNNHQDLLELEIIEFEKRIESRHITRSTTERMTQLTSESARRNSVTSNIVALSNLKLTLQRYYINHGHIRNEMEYNEVQRAFANHFNQWGYGQLTFFEKVYLHQASYWLHYILMDLDQCQFYARQWVTLFESTPKMIKEDIDIYLKGLYHYTTISYFKKDLEGFLQGMKQFEAIEEDSLNDNSKTFLWLYKWQGKLNEAFLKAQYANGIQLIPQIEAQLEELEGKVDVHKIHILYYKFASLYVSNNEADQAISYINQILNQQTSLLREDIHAYTRLLALLVHYELGNMDLLDYLIPSSGRYINKLESPSLLIQHAFQFFKDSVRLPEADRKVRLAKLREELLEITGDPYEQRSFIFLDLLTWVESQLTNKSISAIIRSV